jgi:long-chain acyl-CoA synthetase
MHPLLDRFERTGAARPQRPAVCDQTATLNYRTLQAVAGGLAGQIETQTTQPHVGILAPSSAAGAAALLACWYAGKIPVPLNFLLGPAELNKIVRDAELDLALTIEHFVPAVQAAGMRPLIFGSDTLRASARPPPSAEPGDVAIVLYTSGTSGDPKGVCLSFDNLVQNATACIQHARIQPDQVWLSVLPQFHSFGCTAMTVTPLLLGVTVHYLPRFSPLAVMNLVAVQKVNVFMAIPSMYAALANLKRAEPAALATLTYTISGGEPLPERVYRAFLERFGITIYEGYGMTESSPVAALNTPWEHRPGSVGRPIPGVSVTAVDAHGGALGAGQTGELVIHGHCVMLGYRNKPEASAAAIRHGALWTGDLGYVDRDGYVFITGRAKEMIIVGGENVFPAEIERVLLDHPAVGEAAVIGVQDELRGELPAAFVILKEGQKADETALREFCRMRLAGYKIPRWVRIVTDLPRTPTGKILKRALTPAPRRGSKA